MFLVVAVVVGTPIEYYVASEDTVVAVEYVVAKATSFTFLLQMKIVNSTQTRLLEIISYQSNYLQCDSSTKFLKSAAKERMKRLNAADIIHQKISH